METTIKRKNIDLPVDVLQKLSLMAVAQGRSLKAYIEQLLIAKANSISVEVRDNPSPSGDKWFDEPENMESVRRGIQEMNENKGTAYTMDEIRKSMAFATAAMNDQRMEETPETYKTLAENFKAIAEQLLQIVDSGVKVEKDIETVLQHTREESLRGMESTNQSTRSAWYYTHMGEIEMAFFLGLISPERNLTLHEEWETNKPARQEETA